jgi:hypothetical protein
MRSPSIPAQLRRDAVKLAREIAKKHRQLFASDPELKTRVLRLLRPLLPPRPRRRGRPGDRSVTRALRLLARFRREYPQETSRQVWARIYPLAIDRYADMTKEQQRRERETLHQRACWRRRNRTMRKSSRKIPAEFTV